MSTRGDREQLQAAWGLLTDQLSSLGDDVIAGSPTDEDCLEGLRFVLRQLAFREEQFIEYTRDSWPEPFVVESPTRKALVDCPDTFTRQVNIASDGRYRLSCRWGNAAYGSFTVGRPAPINRVVSHRGIDDITRADDGTFELVVGGEPDDPHSMDTGDDGAYLIIREYCHDRRLFEPAEISIEPIDVSRTPRPALDQTRWVAALRQVGMAMSFTVGAASRMSSELRRHPNRTDRTVAELVGEMAAAPATRFEAGYVRLAEGDALEVTFRPPDANFWSVHLNNFWLESPEYRDGQQVSLNDQQAQLSDDGRVVIVIGADRGGAANWLDTAGRSEAVFVARFVGADQPVELATRLIAR